MSIHDGNTKCMDREANTRIEKMAVKIGYLFRVDLE